MTGDHQTAIVIMSLQCPPKTECPVQGSALKHHSLDYLLNLIFKKVLLCQKTFSS